MNIREPIPSDMDGIAAILEEIELFPPEILGELIQPFFTDSDHPERWLVCDEDGVAGFGFYRPEPLTEGTWNLVAIGVKQGLQGRGLGEKMLRYVEESLVGERLLLIETSSLDDYEKARHFYEGNGYQQMARIPGYWAAGDDKIIFGKNLN